MGVVVVHRATLLIPLRQGKQNYVFPRVVHKIPVHQRQVFGRLQFQTASCLTRRPTHYSHVTVLQWL